MCYKKRSEGGELGQWLRVHTAPSEDPGHCDSRDVFRPLFLCAHTHTYRHVVKSKTVRNKKKKK